MKRLKISLAAAVLFPLGVGLAGCKVKEDEPEPQATSSDAPRSIFQDDPTQDGSSVVPPEDLPPLITTLSFADGTADLTEAVRAELATVADSPQVAAGGMIVLRGHSDSAGTDEETLAASRDRAEAVQAFLVESGIEEERIRIIAFGEQNPVEPNALPNGSPNEEGRAANRRVELTVRTGRTAEREQTLIETLTEDDAGTASGSTETANDER